MVAPIQLKFLVYAPSDVGGLAEHIHYQVRELIKQDVEVVILGSKNFLIHKELKYPVTRCLVGNIGSGNRILKGMLNISIDILNF